MKRENRRLTITVSGRTALGKSTVVEIITMALRHHGFTDIRCLDDDYYQGQSTLLQRIHAIHETSVDIVTVQTQKAVT